MIERTFQNIPEGQIGEADQQSFLVGLGWSRGTAWEGLLRSKRVLIISEAGAGKTHECRVQARRLWDAGEPAFFVELTSLATGELRSLLEDEEEARLDAWLSSQTDVATFFLDSIDELKLSRASFEQALKRVKKAIGGRLRRARIVVTTRPMESFWSMLKRGYAGTFHKISPKHLDRYVTEFAERHNGPEADMLDMMAEVAEGMIGRRLRYEDLTKKAA